MSTTVQTMEYVYSPPLPGRIAAPRGFFVGLPTTNTTSTTTTPTTSSVSTQTSSISEQGATVATVTRTPLDSSILEQQMRMFMVERRGGGGPTIETPVVSSEKPVVGLRRGVPMVQKGSSPPAARLGRKGVSPQMKTSGTSPVAMAENSQSFPVSREQSPAPAASQRLAVVDSVQAQQRRSLSLEPVPQNGRPRSKTDVGSHPPYNMHISRSNSPVADDFRPQVPEKDVVVRPMKSPADHVRSRSLSPSTGHAYTKEKPERRRNVFGLFPSEKKEKEQEGKLRVIAAVFHRKASSGSQQQQAPSQPTANATQIMYTSPFNLSPPQPHWLNQATTPPINQLGWHARNASSSTTSSGSKLRQPERPQHSRDNSSSTNSSSPSHLYSVSGLSKQASFDMDDAIQKVWGPIETSSNGRVQPDFNGSPQQNRRARSRTPQKPFSRQVSNEWPNPSPLLPPVNKEAYQSRTLPPAPALPVALKPVVSEPAQTEEQQEKESSPIEPLLPVAYNPYEPSTPTSPEFEPLQPIAMIPASPRRLSNRVSPRLSVAIPPVGRSVNQTHSAPGTPAEYQKVTSATHEHRYFLELPTGLGEFHLDSEIETQEEDEDDILVWLDSLKFEDDQAQIQTRDTEGVHEEQQQQSQALQEPRVIVDAASPVEKTAATILTLEAVTNSTPTTPADARPRSPSFIPRKPVGSSAKQATPPPSANKLLSPPVAQLSPPTPSDYSAFSGRVSFASSIGDAFKYDLSYAEELPSFDWRSSAGELSDFGGLGLQNVPSSSSTSSSVESSPQTQPSSTFSSPNLSEYSLASTNPPSSSGLSKGDIDAILGNVPRKSLVVSDTTRLTEVYIPDDSASDGMLLSAEIEEVLRAQMAAEQDEFVRRQARVREEQDRAREEQEEEAMEREYLKRMQDRRTRYVCGRNSEFEGGILFVLRSEDIM